jgi:DNA-binding transcriptional regulator GbsR (MarR family)
LTKKAIKSKIILIKEGNMKNLPQTFLDEITSMDEIACANAIIEASKKMQDIEEEQKADPELTEAKQIVKDLNAGYKDAKKLEQNKIKALIKRHSSLAFSK